MPGNIHSFIHSFFHSFFFLLLSIPPQCLWVDKGLGSKPELGGVNTEGRQRADTGAEGKGSGSDG